MARRTAGSSAFRIDTEDGSSGEQTGVDGNSVSSGGGDGDTGGSDSGGNGGNTGADPSDAILGGNPGATIGERQDEFIRDAAGNVLLDVRGRPRKRRSRRSGGRAGATTAAARKAISVDGLSRLLMLGHMTLANFTRTPELEINENEGRILAKPMSDFMALYDVAPDPKLMVIMELMGAASYVYGPRFAVIRMRLAAEKMARAEKEVGGKDVTEPFSPSAANGIHTDLTAINPGPNKFTN